MAIEILNISKMSISVVNKLILLFLDDYFAPTCIYTLVVFPIYLFVSRGVWQFVPLAFHIS
jgi:hypothetical protein